MRWPSVLAAPGARRRDLLAGHGLRDEQPGAASSIEPIIDPTTDPTIPTIAAGERRWMVP